MKPHHAMKIVVLRHIGHNNDWNVISQAISTRVSLNAWKVATAP